MGDGQPWPGWHSAIKKAVARFSSSDELDIALLCINGNDNLSHQQAVDLIEKVRPKAAIPMHYGMDPGNTVEPEIFVEEIEQRAPSQSFIIAKVGEKISYSNGGIL
jgi:L-ascorbate metabolism protein UlaG (beta-lactamase superfamily)